MKKQGGESNRRTEQRALSCACRIRGPTDESNDGVKEPLLDLGDATKWPPAPPEPGKPTGVAP
ncbi:hypothetical protein [Crossiella cryophila]|uniref:Uncharacterized protein n=1 Tax=Crossiella cryophila TaxID=43355 RepID=A0A7W7CFB6_9PSEU|nr:hypothetical protein [Crossiella cryophila]MBB4680128.1 hypothetical protein [Crossiella cryophila]